MSILRLRFVFASLATLSASSCYSFDYTPAGDTTGTTTGTGGAAATSSTGGSTTSACQPDCAAKTCGDDGCDGSCGACDTGQTCTTDGICRCDPWKVVNSDYVTGVVPNGDDVIILDAKSRGLRLDACTGDIQAQYQPAPIDAYTISLAKGHVVMTQGSSSVAQLVVLDPLTLAGAQPIQIANTGSPIVSDAGVAPDGTLWMIGQTGSTSTSFTAPLWTFDADTNELSCAYSVTGFAQLVGVALTATPTGLWLTAQTPRYGAPQTTIAFVPYGACDPGTCICTPSSTYSGFAHGDQPLDILATTDHVYLAGWHYESPVTGFVQAQKAGETTWTTYQTPDISAGNEIAATVVQSPAGDLLVGWAANFSGGTGYLSRLGADLSFKEQHELVGSTLVSSIVPMSDGTVILGGWKPSGGFALRCLPDLSDCPAL